MATLSFEIVAIVALLAVNAFLAASEIALVSARKSRLQAMAAEGNGAAARVLQLTEDPGGFLATVQVGITVASFFASAVGAVSLVRILAEWLSTVSLTFVRESAGVLALVIVTALLSFVSIILGELVPKTIAVRRAEALAVAVVRPLDHLSRLTRPIVALLTWTTNLILRALRVEGRAVLPSVTREELLAMLEAAADEGVVEEAAADRVEDALRFEETPARRIAVPRVDVVALPATATLGEAVDRFFATGFSRIPVFRDSLDQIVGILYAKDAFHRVWTEKESTTRPISAFVRPAFFVPETKPIADLLAELRVRRTQIALLIDEYGGLAGLVTLEDLVEELVGEIADEFDSGHELVRELSGGALEVDGRLPVVDLLDRLGLEPAALGAVEAESVGGLIMDRLGRMPQPGDVIETGLVHFEVLSLAGRRAGIVRVSRPE